MSRSIELKPEFLENDAANILKPYLSISELVKSIVILCLAHILSDTPEATKLAHEQVVVPNIVKYTNKAMRCSDRMCMLIVSGAETMSVGYSLEELVEGLALLAVNDSIKITLMENNVCGIISYLLKSGVANLELLGVDLMWTLSFEKSVREKIVKSEEDLIGSLRPLMTSTKTTPEVRDRCAKTLDFIEKWQTKVAQAEAQSSSTGEMAGGRKSVAPKSGHVFISYSWKQQSTVIRLKQELVKNGFTVWMDVEKMRGDLLEAMAEAVEKAAVVLICFSSTYKQSNPCRTEAEYAHALCKPIVPVNMEYHYFPDGWLGILVRSRKFIDLSLEKRPFEAAFEQLLSELKAIGADALEPETKSSEPRGGGHSTAAPSYTEQETVSKRKFTTWSTDEVKNWLERENLSEFEFTLSDFDGQMLTTLFAMKSSAPDFYYKTVSKHYNGPLKGLLKLLGALDRLWHE